MASAFQFGAFQLHAFQIDSPGAVTDMDVLQLPVNCVLAGQQRIFDRYNEWIINRRRTQMKRVGSHSRAGKISKGPKPSFSVKTDKRGYD